MHSRDLQSPYGLLVEEGKTPRLWVKEGLLMTKGRRMYVQKVGELTKTLLCMSVMILPGRDTLLRKEMHRTLALLERRYYRPNIRDEVEEYVTIYWICQQDKTFTTKLDMALAG